MGEPGAVNIPEHEIHQLKALTLQEALTIGAEHQAGTQGIKQILHHLLLLSCAGIVSFKHLSSKDSRKHRAIKECLFISHQLTISKAWLSRHN
jgi:hypothetical protein